MGQFAGLGARGRARGEWGRPGRVGGSVCRRVNAAGRLTVVSRASRRGGDEDLPTQVAGRSRHCSKNVAASKNALSAPAVRWFQGERTRACRLYTRGGSLNAGLSLPESTRDGRVTDHVQSLRLVRDENWPQGEGAHSLLCQSAARATQEIFESHFSKIDSSTRPTKARARCPYRHGNPLTMADIALGYKDGSADEILYGMVRPRPVHVRRIHHPGNGNIFVD